MVDKGNCCGANPTLLLVDHETYTSMVPKPSTRPTQPEQRRGGGGQGVVVGRKKLRTDDGLESDCYGGRGKSEIWW